MNDIAKTIMYALNKENMGTQTADMLAAALPHLNPDQIQDLVLQVATQTPAQLANLVAEFESVEGDFDPAGLVYALNKENLIKGVRGMTRDALPYMDNPEDARELVGQSQDRLPRLEHELANRFGMSGYEGPEAQKPTEDDIQELEQEIVLQQPYDETSLEPTEGYDELTVGEGYRENEQEDQDDITVQQPYDELALFETGYDETSLESTEVYDELTVGEGYRENDLTVADGYPELTMTEGYSETLEPVDGYIEPKDNDSTTGMAVDQYVENRRLPTSGNVE